MTEEAGIEIALWPVWPEGVAIGPGVNVDADDPALVESSLPRRCCAAKNDGARCRGRALDDGLLCGIHEGRADPVLAARSRVEAARERAARVEDVAALQRLGTRAVIAEALLERAGQVKRTVQVLLDSASTGDLAAAKALVPYFNQALGMPTERVEHTTPSLDEVDTMDTQRLEELVRRGREKRLELVQPVSEEATAEPESA